MPFEKTGYKVLLGMTVIFTVCAILTIIPYAGASKDSIISGYKAYCTFAPVSTVICLLLAGMMCKIRVKKYKS